MSSPWRTIGIPKKVYPIKAPSDSIAMGKVKIIRIKFNATNSHVSLFIAPVNFFISFESATNLGSVTAVRPILF